MEPGMKVICQSDRWWNAHGRECSLAKGEILTIREIYRVGGAMFYKFEEIEEMDGLEDPGFYSAGFTPLRTYH